MVEPKDINENSSDEFEDAQFQETNLIVEPQLAEVSNSDSEAEIKLEACLKCRLEPINELVLSERSYVRRLKIISEKYISLMDDPNINLPEDLKNKWRMLWGNWSQLDEWHSVFLDKLEKIVVIDPDLIPQLFIDSRSRLRTIYSKYCENHRKATVIAEQYKEFFDERRVSVGDKQDVVSHLMQPIQRIMRYQLPMTLIVKLTKRANLPSVNLWERALDVMKEIPKEAQLILEAARIDGFPQSITALGYIRMRGELNIALTSKFDIERDGFSLSDLKFLERRVFLFDQMLLLTEEVKVKRKDPFAQSSYSFRNAVNVNKMKFHPRYSCGNNSVQLEHDLMFMISDETHGREKLYIIDPLTAENREQWVIQLKDIQRMQQDLLLALQDPKRFSNKVDSGGKDNNLLKPSSDSETSNNRGTSCKKKQKWPTFSGGKSGSVLIKHLRPQNEKIPEITHTISARGCSADRKEIKILRSNYLNTSDGELNKSPDSMSVNAKNSTKIEGDILNDEDSINIKQRAWSAFSFRLRRSKRDQKIDSNSHSKSDELGVSNNQQLNFPAESTTPTATNTNNAAAITTTTSTTPVSAQSHKKKSGNIFHMFTGNRNRNKTPATPSQSSQSHYNN